MLRKKRNKMDEKMKLNDEQLSKVSGGTGETFFGDV